MKTSKIQISSPSSAGPEIARAGNMSIKIKSSIQFRTASFSQTGLAAISSGGTAGNILDDALLESTSTYHAGWFSGIQIAKTAHFVTHLPFLY